MSNTIHIPTPLRPFTDKQESVDVSGGTVGELLADLTKKYDGLRKHLYTEDGRLRNFVNVYLNDEDIRYLQKENTPVKPGDALSIVPSVAGGAPTASAGGADLHVGQRARPVPRLRRDSRRHRQLPDAISRERCVRADGQAERVRQHLPLRRAGVGVRDEGRAVLSLPVSGTAAARARTELRGRRRA